MTSEDRPLPPRAAAIAAATGTDFPRWVERIDALGGRELDHASIARQLPERFGISEWWAQGVTVAYEQHIGRREVGQSCTGEYAASASRTLQGELDEVARDWDAFADRERREQLGLGEGRASSTERWRYWRADVDGGSQVSVNMSAKPVPAGSAPRCTVAIEHKGLESAEVREAWKTAWKQTLAEFADRRTPTEETR